MGDMKVVNLCSPTSKVEAKNLRHIRCPLPRFGGGAPKLAAFYNTNTIINVAKVIKYMMGAETF